MVKLYVSGKYAHWEIIKSYIEETKNLGYEITWDWTTEEARGLSLEEAAKRDAQGCIDCDVHLVILDDQNHPYRGTWFEVGVSLATTYFNTNKFIVVCNLTQNEFIDFPFYHHSQLIKTFAWENTRELLIKLLEIMRLTTRTEKLRKSNGESEDMRRTTASELLEEFEICDKEFKFKRALEMKMKIVDSSKLVANLSPQQHSALGFTVVGFPTNENSQKDNDDDVS